MQIEVRAEIASATSWRTADPLRSTWILDPDHPAFSDNVKNDMSRLHRNVLRAYLQAVIKVLDVADARDESTY